MGRAASSSHGYAMTRAPAAPYAHSPTATAVGTKRQPIAAATVSLCMTKHDRTIHRNETKV